MKEFCILASRIWEKFSAFQIEEIVWDTKIITVCLKINYSLQSIVI